MSQNNRLLFPGEAWQPHIYLVRDEFTDTVAAGSVNGTAATPGPGTRTVTDTESKLSVGAGVLAIAGGKASPAYGDPRLTYSAQSRSAGLTYLLRITLGSNLNLEAGWSSGTTGEAVHGVLWSSGFRFFSGGTISITGVSDIALNQEFILAIIARDAGTIAAIKSGGQWQIKWIDIATTAATLYPSISNYNSSISTDYLRVIALPAPFDTDDGLATDTHSGSVAVGTTFTHTADMLLEFTVDTLPSSGTVDVYFRAQDANNAWIARVTDSGAFALVERISGSGVNRAITGVGTILNGHRVVIIADGTTIKGYSNNTLRWTYSSATNFATATAGELNSLGAGGVVSDLKTWPRTLSGAAASILNKASA